MSYCVCISSCCVTHHNTCTHSQCLECSLHAVHVVTIYIHDIAGKTRLGVSESSIVDLTGGSAIANTVTQCGTIT